MGGVSPCRASGCTPPVRRVGTRAAEILVVLVVIGGPAACVGAEDGDIGTPEQRAELFDSILARTERREAWSPVKNQTLATDPLAAMRSLREDVVSARSEQELFYALARLSQARRDRHLDLVLVPDGLALPDSAGLDVADGESPVPLEAPVRVFPDYGDAEGGYFIGDIAGTTGATELPPIGSRVVAVNGVPVAEWERRATAYTRHSTMIGLRWKLAEAMTRSSASYPPALRRPELTLTTVPRGSDDSEESRETVRLPWRNADSLTWRGVGQPRYDGFEHLDRTATWTLLADHDRRILILLWTGFRETMVEDVDALMERAVADRLLDYTLIVDVTRSRGGSRGAYALQRLQGQPFKTTFGNLRISDVTMPFVEQRRTAFAAQGFTDNGTPETVDDGRWLMKWLEEDVVPAVQRGDEWTTTVPFKSAHAPKDSDGILQPAPVHFRGPFAVIAGPSGGSHLDQFLHQVVDNGLGPVVGMPAGGYSNTWEWEELLTLPGSDRPLVRFMWSIGHTVTPRGEIAEGNPAPVDRWLPLTAENVDRYYALLLEAALQELARAPAA